MRRCAAPACRWCSSAARLVSIDCMSKEPQIQTMILVPHYALDSGSYQLGQLNVNW
jgi:hypothetical protein